MNDAQPSGANGGLKAGGLSPDELDKIAAHFVATWDQPTDGLGAIPPPPDDVMTGAMQPAQKNDPKKTMMGIAAPLGAQPEAAFLPPQRAAVDPMAPTGSMGAASAQPLAAKPRSMPAPSLADESGEAAALGRKRSPLPFVIGGGVVVAAVAIFFATRSPDAPPPQKETSAPTVESKGLDLPDPNSVSTSAANTTATQTATAAATETTTAAPAETAAKAAETTIEAEPPAKTAAPTMTAKPPTPPPLPKSTMTAAPKPPPVATTPKPPPTKKPPQKIKDEF